MCICSKISDVTSATKEDHFVPILHPADDVPTASHGALPCRLPFSSIEDMLTTSEAGDAAARPLGSLRDLIRPGEGPTDRSFDRLARLRAVVSPSLRSVEFVLECGDDILASSPQTSISSNRIPSVVFWLIAAFRYGSRKSYSQSSLHGWTECGEFASNSKLTPRLACPKWTGCTWIRVATSWRCYGQGSFAELVKRAHRTARAVYVG